MNFSFTHLAIAFIVCFVLFLVSMMFLFGT